MVPEICWVESPGHVLVKNLGGSHGPTNPTKEELEKEKDRVLEVYLSGDDNGGNCILIPPGQSLMFRPLFLHMVEVRTNTPTSYRVTVFPR